MNFRNTFIFQQSLTYIATILPWTSRSSLTHQKAEQWLFLCILVTTKNPPRGNYTSGLVEDSLMQGRVKEETVSILQKYYLLLHKHLYCTVTLVHWSVFSLTLKVYRGDMSYPTLHSNINKTKARLRNISKPSLIHWGRQGESHRKIKYYNFIPPMGSITHMVEKMNEHHSGSFWVPKQLGLILIGWSGENLQSCQWIFIGEKTR